MKSKFGILAAVVLSAALSQAVPTIDPSSVGLTAFGERGGLKVDYVLSGGPAVVTFGVETNAGGGVWAPVSDAVLTRAWGDVNRLVRTDGEHSFSVLPSIPWRKADLASGALRVALTAWPTNAPPPYMAIDTTVTNRVLYYATAEALPGGLDDDRYRTDYLLLRKIPAAGEVFAMGSWTENSSLSASVRLTASFSADFYMGVYELTWGQFRRLTGRKAGGSTDGGFWGAADSDVRPLEYVTYNELRGNGVAPSAGHGTVGNSSFVQLMRTYSGIELDLPTTAEWEFAARGGCDNSLLGVDGVAFTEENVLRYAWTKSEATETVKVGTKEPNGYGLYDMLGNVEEMTIDWSETWMPEKARTYLDSTGAATGTNRTRCGSSFGSTWQSARLTYQLGINPTPWRPYNWIGCRLMCPAVCK